MILVGLLIGATIGWPANAQEPPSAPPFVITITVPLTTASPGARIPFTASMTNTSNHAISLESGERIAELGNEVERQMSIMVYDSQGDRVAETNFGRLVYGRRYKWSPGKTVCCARWMPGESYAEDSDLVREFDLSKPGGYSAQAQRYDEETKSFVYSNRVSFTVISSVRGAQVPALSFSLSVATPAVSFPAGSTIRLTASMTNISGNSIVIRREWNHGLGKEVNGRIILSVRDGEGQPVPRTMYGESQRVGEESTRALGQVAVLLAPGEVYREDADLSKEFALRAGSTYTVEAQKRDAVSGAIIRSNKITFRVVP